MKQLILILFLCCFSSTFFSQVGIHNTNPKASLDITASNIATPSNTDGILIPRINNFPSPNPTADQNGMLVFATGNGTPSKGFYYWDNTLTTWTSVLEKNTLGQAYNQGGAGAGRIITANDGAVNINGEDGLLVTGTYGSGETATLGGTRMFFNPKTASFRAGYLLQGSIGDFSTSMGNANSASGNSTTSFGNNTTASGDYSFAVGNGNTASGTGAMALGYGTEATGDYSFSVGQLTTASGKHSVAMGSGTTASGKKSFAMGIDSGASANYSTAIGSNSTASGVHSLAMGNSNTASGDNSSVFGFQNTSPSYAETTIGFYATEYVPNATIFNDNADRLFSIGNGTGDASRSNALTIYKSGLMNINDQYNMPLNAGTANQIMQIDGSAQVNFVDLSTLQDGTGTDDQTIDTFSFNATTNVLSVELENDANGTQTVDLSNLQDGTGNDWTTTGNAGTDPTTNFIGTTDNKDVVLKTNNTERARFLSNGKVGIGITAPDTRLTIKGIISASNDDAQTNKINITHGGTNAYINVIGSGRLDFKHEGTTGMSFTDQKRLGIATNAPTETLSVAGITNLNQGGTGIALKVNGTEALSFDGTQFSWGIGGSKNYFEDNVGIGNSNPGYKLSVIDNQASSYVARFRNSSTNADADGIRINIATTSTTATNSFIGFYRGLAIANGRIEGNGTGVLYQTTSDRRLKTNIKDITKSLDLLDKIQPRLYEYKANLGTKEYGFIAQELQRVYPQAVSGDPNGNVKTDPMMVDYSRLTPILTAGIKELNKKVLKQQKEIENLKTENKELKQQLKIIKSLEKRMLLLENKNDH